MNSRVSPGVDLTNCDREPIHQLGFIQQFGGLLALTMDWLVAHRSANFPEIVPGSDALTVGERLQDYFLSEACDRLRERLRFVTGGDRVDRIFGLRLTRSENEYDIALHISGEYIILEIEPHVGAGVADQFARLRPIMDELQRINEIDALCQEAARHMKDILGFDRVMVYRFHPDESGEVVAEVREPELESFLNLRYPKTDIPQQARKLYLRNLFRIISDVNGEPVPIEPGRTLTGEPIDLSLSTLRAVSPIHIEYLQNMGVGASLSISIVIDGKLWGLFACHHYSARFLPYPMRTMAELFSQLFSLRLEMALCNAGNAVSQQAQAMHDRLMARLTGGTVLSEHLPVIEETIGEIIRHDGSSSFIDGVYTSRGIAPSEEEFRALVPILNSTAAGRIVASERLESLIPAAQAFKDRVVGALFVPVSRKPRDYVVLWRRDLPHTVTWAGNPDKPVSTGPHGDRLTPRKSFAAWKESVTGRSATWTEEELSVAEKLRVTLLEVILRITDEAMQERNRAQERQELLIAELNHRVRNILTLIRGLVSQSRGETNDVEAFAGMIGGRIRALAAAHDAITQKHWAPASLHDLIRAESEAYIASKAQRVMIEGADVLVLPEAYTVLALVVHEMMTNSAKYGALCDQKGSVRIETEIDRFGDLHFTWKERGGPPVKAPKRRGFGSTIIEKSIPHELKGEAEISYRLPGVEAEFVIPARFVQRGETAGKQPKEANMREHPTNPATRRPGDGPVLLVEDSLIIALDGEEMLRQLGFENVDVAGNVTAAMEAIERAKPQFALLDYNLGDESSEAVAERLEELDVPYWFVTGYGDAIGQLSERSPRGVVQKPYTQEQLGDLADGLLGENPA